mmetsp:Transcript_48686/g.96081  ORF Transcript_48686/g.96081 Transcript_48686/m.96081 type:complete len:650 (+) Transcript_48686:148-2097(+)
MQKAESLKASGTQKYQRGDFLGALADYLSALEVVSSGNPLEKSTTPNLTVVIESNISAVLYEFGSYTDSLAHSQKVLDLLSDVQQLSAKEESIKDKNVKRMEKIQKITIHHENFGDGKTQDPVAREIIRKLPRYRPMRLTEAMEMYVGHDPAASALRLARDDQLVDETSEKGDRRNLTVDEVWKKAVDIFSEDEKGGSTYSVFYGGCGDGRHYMMTLIDLARQISRGGGNCSRSFNFVLNDIHPVVIARLHWSSNYRRPSLSLQPPQKTYRERAPREMPRSVCSFSLRAFSSPRIYAMVFLPAVKEAIEAAEKLLSQIEGGREEPGWKAVLFGVSLDAPTLRSAVVRWREWHAGANTVSNKEARRGWSVDPTENDRAVGMDFRALASAHPEMQEVRAQKVQEEKDRIRQMVMSQSEEEFRSSCDQAIQTSLVEQGVITEGQWISLSLDEQKEVVVKQLSGLVEDRLDKSTDEDRPQELRLLDTLVGDGWDWICNECVLERYFVWKCKYLLPPGIAVAVLNEQVREEEQMEEKEGKGGRKKKGEHGIISYVRARSQASICICDRRMTTSLVSVLPRSVNKMIFCIVHARQTAPIPLLTLPPSLFIAAGIVPTLVSPALLFTFLPKVQHLLERRDLLRCRPGDLAGSLPLL